MSGVSLYGLADALQIKLEVKGGIISGRRYGGVRRLNSALTIPIYWEISTGVAGDTISACAIHVAGDLMMWVVCDNSLYATVHFFDRSLLTFDTLVATDHSIKAYTSKVESLAVEGFNRKLSSESEWSEL